MGSRTSKPISQPQPQPSLSPRIILQAVKKETPAEKEDKLKHQEIIFYSKKKEYHIDEQLR